MAKVECRQYNSPPTPGGGVTGAEAVAGVIALDAVEAPTVPPVSAVNGTIV